MNKFVRLASIAAFMVVLSACGAKGPLFMPEKPAPVEEMPAVPAADAPATEVPATEVPATDASDPTVPVEPPEEVPPATPPADGNG